MHREISLDINIFQVRTPSGVYPGCSPDCCALDLDITDSSLDFCPHSYSSYLGMDIRTRASSNGQPHNDYHHSGDAKGDDDRCGVHLEQSLSCRASPKG
jgi:hypothetical protein